MMNAIRGVSLLLVGLGLASTAWVTSVPAQTPCQTASYTIAELAGVSSGLTEAHAINRHHQTIGMGLGSPSRRYAIRWQTSRGNPELLSPASSAAAFGLSSNGLVAGRIDTAEGERGAVWDRRGRLRWLPPVTGHEESAAYAVNAFGVVVGSSTNTNGETFAVRWKQGEGAVLLSRDGARGVALAINDRGQIAGNEATASTPERAVLWSERARVLLPGLGAGPDEAESIDGTGRFVTGTSFDPATGEPHAVLWTDRAVTNLGHPGQALGSAGHGVNEHGTVVGDMTVSPTGSTVAVIWRAGTLTRLSTLLPADADWTLVSARAINDAGEIVGYGRRGKDGAMRAFVMRPVMAAGPSESAACPQSS